MCDSFWHRKRVLVTGCTGFKGSWLSLWLSRLGAAVSGYSLGAPTKPSLFELAGITSHVDLTTGDVRDLQALSGCVKRQRPDIVLHLAAQSLVRRSYADPVGTYATNVLGTVHLLEAVRPCDSVGVVINVTSDKCYENRDLPWGYRETDPMGGSDPYSSSKGCAELVAAAYRRSFFEGSHSVRLGSVRAGNVIGGGDWADDRIVPDCIRALMEGRPPDVRHPRSVRPWQHVLEPLAGYLLYAQRLWERAPGIPEALNFGPSEGDTQPVSELVRVIVERWGFDSWTAVADEPDPLPEAGLLRLDSTLANVKLGWHPRMTFREAVNATVDWYREYQSGGAVEAFTLGQIGAYEKAGRDRSVAAVQSEGPSR